MYERKRLDKENLEECEDKGMGKAHNNVRGWIEGNDYIEINITIDG